MSTLTDAINAQTWRERHGLPKLPDVADMSMVELCSELLAHGYTPEDLTHLKAWTDAAEMVAELRAN